MQLANTIMCKFLVVLTAALIFTQHTTAQNNSPYSRYGIGDLSNPNNIQSRGMGSIGIGLQSDRFSNNANPASYAALGLVSGKGNGNIINFEVATQFNSNTLLQKTPLGKYNTKNLVYNYMQLGLQAGKKGNWGFNIALLPIARENYKIRDDRRLSNIDSLATIYDGNGGAYKALIGTGYRHNNFSFGLNTGLLFGKKSTTTNLAFINDTATYYESSSNSRTNFYNLFCHTGVQYNHKISKTKNIIFGATYQLQNKLIARQDIERFVYDNDNPNANTPGAPAGIDTVLAKYGTKGTIVLPSTIGIGVTYNQLDKLIVGLDLETTSWNNYRFYDQQDQVKSNYTIKAGLQYIPARLSKNYWSGVSYRFGANYGTDYVTAAGSTIPVYNLSFGLGLPVPSNARIDKSLVQPVINLAVEAGKRGNNTINVSENFVRIAASVSLADFWFFRRKFD